VGQPVKCARTPCAGRVKPVRVLRAKRRGGLMLDGSARIATPKYNFWEILNGPQPKIILLFYPLKQ